jgi:hypothetical protein
MLCREKLFDLIQYPPFIIKLLTIQSKCCGRVCDIYENNSA